LSHQIPFGGRAVPGSTRTSVRHRVVRYNADSQCNYFVGSFQWGDITHREASRSMELFTTEVMPHFADALATGSPAD